jgi:hypothetical protein
MPRTSNVNAGPIDNEYPVAGVDNDTQGFRDNFTYIKTAFNATKTELEELLNYTARTDVDNSFNSNFLSNAVFKQNQNSLNNYGTGSGVSNRIDINFGNADYQVYRLNDDVTFEFEGFSNDNVNKVTIELLSDGGAYTVDFFTDGAYPIKKSSNFPTTLTVSSTSNPILIEIITRAKSQDPGSLGRIVFLNYLGQFA